MQLDMHRHIRLPIAEFGCAVKLAILGMARYKVQLIRPEPKREKLLMLALLNYQQVPLHILAITNQLSPLPSLRPPMLSPLRWPSV